MLKINKPKQFIPKKYYSIILPSGTIVRCFADMRSYLFSGNDFNVRIEEIDGVSTDDFFGLSTEDIRSLIHTLYYLNHAPNLFIFETN